MNCRMSWPSMRTAPACGSYSRGSSWAIVLLPAPLCPTSATDSPAATRKLTDSQRQPPARPVRAVGQRLVGEADVPELDLAAQRGRRSRVRRVHHGGSQVEQIVDPLHAGVDARHLVPLLDDPADRLEHVLDQQDERDEVPGGDRAADVTSREPTRMTTAMPRDSTTATVKPKKASSREVRRKASRAELALALELPLLDVAPAVHLDEADRRQHLLRRGRQLPLAGPQLLGGGLDPPGEDVGDHRQQGHDGDGEQRDLPDCREQVGSVAARMNTLPTRSLTESSTKSSMALTSPVIRVRTSPVPRRRWKASGSRCRWPKSAPRRLNPSVRAAVAR